MSPTTVNTLPRTVVQTIKGEEVECFDLLPIRRMNGLLVSEISGADIDAIGILKNDVLGIRELTRLSDILRLIKNEYGITYTILEIANKYLDDPKVFQNLKAGNTQGVFQMSGEGITKYIKRMAPDNINDVIASVALFRPGPLDSGSADGYVRAKRGEFEPSYLWGTYEILSDTYSFMIYQEQISQVAQKVGNLSLGDGVNLVKALSKKKLEKVRKFQSKFFEGAKANGCPKEAADKIWSDVEDAAKYSFNKCIAGSESFYCRKGKITISEMWHAKNDRHWAKENGMTAQRNKYLDRGYGNCLSWDGRNRLVMNQIVDIRFQGVRPVYRITLENMATLDVTDNHKHPTLSGKKRTDELEPGVDYMYVAYSGTVRGTLMQAGVSKVVSVKYLCDMETFDVEMADPHHNFVTGNGIVTCNSHATAYGLTAYVGAWLKTHYPTAFYTVVLRDQDDDKMAVLMNEIENVSGTTLEKPDINISGENFTADFKKNVIYWSLGRVKFLGPKAVRYIVQERELYGPFYDLEDFVKRIFKSKFKSFDDEGTSETIERCPVTARSVKNLIFAGAFDTCENIPSILNRYDLLVRAAELLGFELTEKDVPEDMRGEHYYWCSQQIAVSGHGAIDYKRIYDKTDHPKGVAASRFIHFKDLTNMFYTIQKGASCASVVEVSDKSYKDRQTGQTKHFGKLVLQQNNETNILTIWDDWATVKPLLKDAANRIIAFIANVKWSDYDEKNTLQINKVSFLKLI